MWKNLFFRPRQIVGWLILFLIGTYITANFESWLDANKANEHWKMLLSEGGRKQLIALTNIMISPFATGFGAATLVFLVWDLFANFRRLRKAKRSAPIIPGEASPARMFDEINSIKVHAPRKEEYTDIHYYLDNLTTYKKRFHHSKATINFIEIYIDTVKRIYKDEISVDKDSIDLFRTYSEGIADIVGGRPWMCGVHAFIARRRLRLAKGAIK